MIYNWVYEMNIGFKTFNAISKTAYLVLTFNGTYFTLFSETLYHSTTMHRIKNSYPIKFNIYVPYSKTIT